MVKIRLRRKGRIHHPVYDIVIVDQKARRDGAYIERIGHFDPNTSPSTASVDRERSIYWLGVGAQPTDTVKRILSYEGVLLERFLQGKGVSEEEIAEKVEKHKENANARYFKQKENRKKKAEEKGKAAAEPETEEAPAEAEAPAEEG
jgi:small subunit ribosomal protein S16